ncbi:hypothetical protein EYR38_003657 [Pleurotus pulmonarius]|nr:hypothetical protein EYR38_003657 [Pleurotus pulmonarius]
MSQLPNELLQAIVSHSERTSLLNLAIVSKRFNALAIPILYQDIIFHIKDVIPISLLRRDIHTNQGIQYTKAFAIHFFPCHFDGHDQVRADVDYIIPHLVNIRRLCLARQCVSPGVLSRLPASVQLTDLILDHTHCSQDLPRFLLCNPTLEAVAVHNSANDGRAIELAASNLPKLRTLEIAFNELVHIKGPMPSVANLSVHPFPLDRRATGHIVLNFPSLCSLSLPHVDLPVVFSLAQSLPNLEFLRVSFGNSNVRPNASDFAVFSKLRYMRFVLHRFSDEGLALELFHAVQSLVIMEYSLVPMSQLPNELLRAIVAHLERKTLLDLTIVSKRIHAMALPILYKDITFHLEDELPISLLRRDIQTNAGIQYTKAFAIYFFPCYFDDYDEIRADIDYIIPYLVNVRRFCLTRQCASPGVLSLLPTSARLTHLILDHTHCSEDLSQFLSCNPTLESIAIHNGDLVDGHVIELVARNLPKLYSLEIVLNDLVHIQSPMPSITNLGILDIESISASGFLLNFPSLRRLCLPESGLPAVLALASFLPNIEFLEVYPMDQESRLIASDFAPFSKLKYVKYGMIIVRNSLPLELFDSVKSLVVVDAADPHTTSRWFRGSITPLKHDTPGDDAYLWEGWWDYEEALIEEANTFAQPLATTPKPVVLFT